MGILVIMIMMVMVVVMMVVIVVVIVLMIVFVITFTFAFMVVFMVMIVVMVVVMIAFVMMFAMVMFMLMLMFVVVLAVVAMLVVRELLLLDNSWRWGMICPARVSVPMNKVATTMLEATLSKLHGRHHDEPILIVRVASVQPPGIDLSRHATVSAILFEFVLFIRLPHWVDLILNISHISRDIH